MPSILKRPGLTAALALFWVAPCFAMDSYRFLHVTIDTPWSIFVFLLLTIFTPFVLMAVLVWRYAERKTGKRDSQSTHAEGKE